MKTKFMKIFRRVVALVCVVPVLLCGMASPVSASAVMEDPGFLIDLLDYGPSSTDSNYISFVESGDLTYIVPDSQMLSYVDVTFSCRGASVTDIYIFAEGVYREVARLEVVSVGGNIYRAYGSFTPTLFHSIRLEFYSGASTRSDVTILGLTVGNFSMTQDVEAYCEIMALPYEGTIHYVPTDTINYRTWTTSSDSDFKYGLALRVEDWRKYDYVDILMYTTVGSITSITCNMNGVAVPCSVSYLENDVTLENTYTYTIRMDLRSLDRSAAGNAVAVVSGTTLAIGQLNYVDVMSVHGYVSFHQGSPVVTFLGRFQTIFYEILAYLENLVMGEDTGASSEFNNNLSDSLGELDNIDDVLQSVTRPALDDIDINITSKLDPVSFGSYSGALTVLMQNEYISLMLVFAFTLALVAYVLFGKR